MSTGAVRLLPKVPSPSWASMSLPQHFTAPPPVTAHVWEPPMSSSALLWLMAIVETPELNPDTSTGVDRSVVVPSPSWPASLWPQHLAAPPVVTAQVAVPPA